MLRNSLSEDICIYCFFCKQKTAYEMRISDWSSDVCSSDLMTHKGQAFELAFKHRQLDIGPKVYRACGSLQQTTSRLYRQAGIKLVHQIGRASCRDRVCPYV